MLKLIVVVKSVLIAIREHTSTQRAWASISVIDVVIMCFFSLSKVKRNHRNEAAVQMRILQMQIPNPNRLPKTRATLAPLRSATGKRQAIKGDVRMDEEIKVAGYETNFF